MALEKRRPDRKAGPRDLSTCDIAKDSANRPILQLSPRLARVGYVSALNLSLLRCAGEPGHMTGSQLSADLSALWRRLLGPAERIALAVVAIEALGPNERADVLDAALGIPPLGDD